MNSRTQSLELDSDSECEGITVVSYSPGSVHIDPIELGPVDLEARVPDPCSPLGSPDLHALPQDSGGWLLAEYIPFSVAGHGSGGTVWLAQHRVSKQIVAIKCISSIQSREQQQRVRMELHSHTKSSAQQRNNHVVKLKFACWHNGRAWAVVEYCDGGNVSQMQKQYNGAKGSHRVSNDDHVPKLSLYTPPTVQHTPKQHTPSWNCCLSLFVTGTQYSYAKETLDSAARNRSHRHGCLFCCNSSALCSCSSERRFKHVCFVPETRVIEDANRQLLYKQQSQDPAPNTSLDSNTPFQGQPPKWQYRLPVWKQYGTGDVAFIPESAPTSYVNFKQQQLQERTMLKRKRSLPTVEWMDNCVFDWSSNSSGGDSRGSHKVPKKQSTVKPPLPPLKTIKIDSPVFLSPVGSPAASGSLLFNNGIVCSPLFAHLESPVTPTMTTRKSIPNATWHEEDAATSSVPQLRLPVSLKKSNIKLCRDDTAVVSAPTLYSNAQMRKDSFTLVFGAMSTVQHDPSSESVEMACLTTNPGIPDNAVAGVSYQIQQGLKHLHSVGILHRDITPQNVLFTAHGVVKVADLGVSTEISAKLETKKTFVGTLKYMCAERLMGEGHSFGTDVWAAGCVAAEMALGTPLVEWQNGQISEKRSNYDTLQYDTLTESKIHSAISEKQQHLPFLAILSLMTHNPMPCLPLSLFSPLQSAFVRACIAPVHCRPSPTALLTHPFILYYLSTPYQRHFAAVATLLAEQLKQSAAHCVFLLQWTEAKAWDVLHNLATEQDFIYLNQAKSTLPATLSPTVQNYGQLYSTTILLHLHKNHTLSPDSIPLNLRLNLEYSGLLQRMLEQKAQQIVKDLLDVAKPAELDLSPDIDFKLVSGWWNAPDEHK